MAFSSATAPLKMVTGKLQDVFQRLIKAQNKHILLSVVLLIVCTWTIPDFKVVSV